jgi:hypothetical protein
MLNSGRAGIALGATFATFYALCSLLFVVWPQGYMAAVSMLFHGFELTPAPHVMSFGGFLAGALCISIAGYLIGAIYSFVWNALAGGRSTVKTLPAAQP